MNESGILDDQVSNEILLRIVVLEEDLKLGTTAFRVNDRVSKAFGRRQLRRKEEPIRRW